MSISVISKENSPAGKFILWKKTGSPYSGTPTPEAGKLSLCVSFELAKYGQDTYQLKFLHESKLTELHLHLREINNMCAIADLGPQTLKGMYIVFTGTLTNTREFYASLVKSHSGVFQASVTAATTHLVTSDPTRLTTKLKKAKASGLPILSEEQFLAKVNGKD